MPTDEGVDPGFGAWRANVDIPVRIRVDSGTAGQEPVEMDVVVHVNECGVVDSPHVILDMLASEPSIVTESGPSGCERP